MTRPEKISRMKRARNADSGVRVNNVRTRERRIHLSARQVLMIVIMLFLSLGSGISHVWSNFEVTQKGYDISHLKNEEMRLRDINRKLRIELGMLKSPNHLEKLAKNLGLEQPSPEQIVVLK